MWHVCGTRWGGVAPRGTFVSESEAPRMFMYSWSVSSCWRVRGCRLAGAAGGCRRLIPLAEPQDGREGFVDPPLLVWADPAHQIAQPSGVDRADLLN